MDSSTAKMKQKPINAFFAASAKKEEPKSTQRKISAFFGGAAKAELTPGTGTNAAKTLGGPAATPPGTCGGVTPAARLSLEPNTALDAAEREEGSQLAAAAAAAAAKIKDPTVARSAAKAPPAGGSTSKPKAPGAAPARGSGKAGSKAKGEAKSAKPGGRDKAKAAGAAGGGRKRLRRVVMEDEEDGDAVEEGLEDDVGGDDGQLEDSDYEGGSGSGSDEDFSAEEEEEESEDEGAEEEEESDGEAGAAVGAKRKRPPAKSSAPAKKSTASKAGAAGARGAPAAATPTPARTPCGARTAGLTTPHHGTASKGPAAATAGTAGGRSAVTTPGTVAPALGGACGSAGRGRSTGGNTVATPSSARSAQSALADTPSKSQGASEISLGVAASMEGEAARFADRMASRFSFLNPDNIKDANGRRPDHPDYDPRTLYIPPGWFKEFKVSEGQQQWWNFKAQNFDSVLLFKMGKFYEMFEMDAYVGVEVLGLTFMKGDQPHAGFPEVKYADMAESLARAGYRVVVVEQTETPEMLAKRNEQLKRQGKKQAGVVDRQKVAVLSRGTLVDAEMVTSRPDASYVLAVAEAEVEGAEAEVEGGGVVRIGLCAVDAASGQLLLGEFVDDEVRSSLRTQLTALQPQELVLPRKALSATTSHVLRNGVRDPRVNNVRGSAGDWSAEKTYRMLRDAEYFTASAAAPTAHAVEEDGSPAADQGGANGASAMEVDGGKPELDPSKRWPALLRRFVADGVSSRPAAMAALGGIIAFLRDALLDRAVLPLGRFEELPALAPRDGNGGAAGPDASEDSAGPLYMALNGAALENLEILENGDGGSAGTLLSVLDNCATPFGRRRLRQWLCRPLGRIADIEARQDAVAELGGSLAEAAGQARKQLAGVSDLERAVARLHASTVAGASGRDASNVVLYEDAGKRRVAALTGALKDLRAAHGALAKLREALGPDSSALLRRVVVDRCRPAEVSAALEALEGATDWKEAANTGRAVPEPGVDEEYDAAAEAVEAVEKKMNEYVKEVRKRFGCEASLISVNKDSHLLEMPESVAGRLGGEFHLMGNRKGYKRFTTNRLKALVLEYDKAVERKEDVLSSILTRLLVKFVTHKALWVAVVEAVAELDALMSLAAHAMSPPDGGPMCRPKLVPARPRGGSGGEGDAAGSGNGGGGGAIFDAVALRHPAGIGGRNNGAFVPNDVHLGGGGGGDEPEGGSAGSSSAPPFILLSGPNMGGKSTLLRQVCLATVLAQVGACVPAESLTLSPADAIFVRMGARDAILTGQSTFFIELAETAAMLAKATRNSLVVLDELGRGTATLDGAAVAGAVLQHLATTTGCRGLFATHYHHLSDEHANDPRVAVMHMACAVEGAGDEEEGAAQEKPDGAAGAEEVTFLYRLTSGACPKSYGTNVARLAGLPPSVVTRAAEVSAQWDQRKQQQPADAAGEAQAHGRDGDAMEVDGGAAPAQQGKAAELGALLSEIRSWRSGGGDQPDLARLRELQAAAAVALQGAA